MSEQKMVCPICGVEGLGSSYEDGGLQRVHCMNEKCGYYSPPADEQEMVDQWMFLTAFTEAAKSKGHKFFFNKKKDEMKLSGASFRVLVYMAYRHSMDMNAARMTQQAIQEEAQK